MIKKFNKKKLLTLIYTYIILTTFSSTDVKKNKIIYNSNYNIGNYDEYCTLNDKKIFIISDVNDILDNENIYIYDYRNSEDPNVKIYNSYRFNDISTMNSIIDIIQSYEKDFPSDWNRESTSMLIEWILHNVVYDLNIERNSSVSVDFNNDDQYNLLSNNISKLEK